MRQKNALFRAGLPEGDTVREAVFCRLLSGASGSSIFQRLYYSKFGFFVQAAVCPACGTKTAVPPQKTAESAMKPPFFCHAGVTKYFSAHGCCPQIRMVKIAVDSGMCFVPTEHCMRRQTLPCRICPTPEPILRKCSVRAGNEIVLPSS